MSRVVLLMSLAAVIALPAAASLASPQASSFRDRVKASIDVGVKYLRFQQQPDGSWNDDLEATALIVRAMMESHRQYREPDGPFVANPLRYIASQARSDGSFGDGADPYRSALALHALALSGNEDYRPLIDAGVAFLAGALAAGNGGDTAPDIDSARLAIVLDALSAARVPRSAPIWNAARNALTAAGADDTAALLFARLRLNDASVEPLARQALAWLQSPANRAATTDDRTGAAFRDIYFIAATLDAASDLPEVRDDEGNAHPWQELIAEKLMALQRFEGDWTVGDPVRDRAVASPFALLALEQIYNQ